LALPVFTADVDDNFGDLLFALNVPSPAAKTGSILPNPQTAFGLPPSTIEIITNGAPAYVAEDLSVEPQQPTFADLLLLGVDGTVISDTRFVATFPTPEPAGWALAGAGLGLLLIGVGVFHRRNSDVSRG
jgi:hypothetical protein